MRSRRHRVVKRVAPAVLLALFAVSVAAPASAWHAETFVPAQPQRHLENVSVTVGQRAWVLTVRTDAAEPVEYISWYLDVGDDGPGQHRGAEFLMVSAPGERQLFTLPTADPGDIGSLACDRIRVVPLRTRSGEKVRIPQRCLGAPDRLRVRVGASAGEQSVSWSPGSRSTDFHGYVDNVTRPVA